jgi:glycopeptide antibiotics resistance protein
VREIAANKTINKTKRAAASIADSAISIMGVVYTIFLVWVILWKCAMPFIGDGTEQSINLLLFNGNTRWELEFNIAIFIPLGFYLVATAQSQKLFVFTLIRQLLTVLFMSFMLEVMQFILAVGRSDVTDLLTNTLGGAIGIIVTYAIMKLFGRHKRKAALVISTLLTLFVLYLSVSFVLFGQVSIGGMMINIL